MKVISKHEKKQYYEGSNIICVNDLNNNPDSIFKPTYFPSILTPHRTAQLTRLRIIFLPFQNEPTHIAVITQSMNIQNLLKKIGERRERRKECAGAISSERIGKPTYEDTGHSQASIGTLNQMPNTQNDRSYFKQYFEDFGGEGETGEAEGRRPGKLQRIENELDEIEKMKCVFENKKRLDTHGSIDRNCPTRSVEKHTLKPSQVPRFKQTSEFVVNATCDFKDNHSCTFKDESFNNINKTEEVISFKGAEIFDDSRQDSKRTISLGNEECWGKGKAGESMQLERCVCEGTLRDFMAEVGQKMGTLATRITQLEQSNASLRAKHDRVAISNIRAAQILQKLEQEKQQLLETQQKWTESKGQLQALLKGVISKKEKDGPKENMSKEDCENYFKNKEKGRSPLKKQNALEEKKGNKNKVESLLQRLQLRVEKS